MSATLINFVILVIRQELSTKKQIYVIVSLNFMIQDKVTYVQIVFRVEHVKKLTLVQRVSTAKI